MIKASSGLSEMKLKHGERCGSACRRRQEFSELVATRNTADQMIHATEKSLEEMGDKVEQEERMQIEMRLKI